MSDENPYAKFLDADFPLLVEMRERSPGTHKHCQNVMNICENVASKLDIEKDVIRCAALYHDVGKILNPEWFTENQEAANPHDDIDPFFSYNIITRHVSDSIMLLVEYNFPPEILKIVSCHHGKSVVLYFWNKAGASEEELDNYRYKTPIPTDDASNILMICDRVEATAKSLFPRGELKTEEGRNKVIEDSFNIMMEDGQLDNLTFGVGRVIKDVLRQELKTMYQDRIDYDKAKEEKEEE